ncbi:bifunctional endoribonuclease/protein kinase ire1, partial [Ceratobasidium sp. 392]
MLSTLIQLCLVLAVLCAASEYRPTSDARLRKFSSDLAAVRRAPHTTTHERYRRGERPVLHHHAVVSDHHQSDIRLADIVLAASIDGHFHALNRTTGELLWSMTDDLAHSQSPRDPHTDSAPSLAAQSPLYNLVRSDHRALVDPDSVATRGDEDDLETYIVEPQSGDIFVMATDGDAAVEHLGYSVPQLVELSPFRPPGDDERIFVGKKTTSLISLDLLTGRILGVYGEQCTWDDSASSSDGPVDVDALLDDLDGTRELPKKQRPVEVVIGRTDYHVSVHVKGKGVVQNLAFTKYGPNNVHRAVQAAWTRSPDSVYFQPSPDGNKLYSFANGGLLRFERTYPVVVAVFDAVFLPTKRNPILLLQPTPKLSELSSAYRSADMNVPDVTFIGRIDDSLFALSHIHYPLVVFPASKKSVLRIDDGGKTPTNPQIESDQDCDGLNCFVGTKQSRFASRSGLNRLLDEARTLGIDGTASVESEDEVEAVYPDPHHHQVLQSHTRTRERTKTPAGVRPTPTKTHNSSEHSVPSPAPREEEDKDVPVATPSHRTALARLASEWVAAWAGMTTVLLSTIIFGFGFVSKGKGGIWKAKEAEDEAAAQTEKEATLVDEPEQEQKEEETEDDTPPPVPPKPASFSFSRMTGSPYAITVDSRPAPPPKDPTPSPTEARLSAVKKIRPRTRAGLPNSASIPTLPNLTPIGDNTDVAESARTTVELLTTEQEETELEPEIGAEPGTPGKRRVRRGRRGKGRGKGGKGGPKEEDVTSGGENAPPTIIATAAGAGGSSEGSESFVKIEKAPVVVPKSSLVVTENVLGYGSHGTVVYKGRFQGR